MPNTRFWGHKQGLTYILYYINYSDYFNKFRCNFSNAYLDAREMNFVSTTSSADEHAIVHAYGIMDVFVLLSVSAPTRKNA